MTEPLTQIDNFGQVFAPAAAGLVGYFRFFFADQRWEWSDEAYRIHGYQPGEVVPTTDLLLAHKHPDDRDRVASSLRRLVEDGVPFGSRHRIIDNHGDTRHVLVVGDRLFGDAGTAIGAYGYYVDLTYSRDDQVQAGITEAVAEISTQRAVIEQVKGMLMVIYGIDAQRAFDVLLWRSQTINVKLRDLAVQLVRDIASADLGTAQQRQTFDHLLLTAHERITH